MQETTFGNARKCIIRKNKRSEEQKKEKMPGRTYGTRARTNHPHSQRPHPLQYELRANELVPSALPSLVITILDNQPGQGIILLARCRTWPACSFGKHIFSQIRSICRHTWPLVCGDQCRSLWPCVYGPWCSATVRQHNARVLCLSPFSVPRLAFV